MPEPLKSGALEWYANLSVPSRPRAAAKAAKEKTPRFGSARFKAGQCNGDGTSPVWLVLKEALDATMSV